MLLGIPGDNTYLNYQEANRTVWRLTLLPLEKVCAALNNWLVPRFGEDLGPFKSEGLREARHLRD